MDEHKGKGRILDDQKEKSSLLDQSSGNPSLLSRIAASADGLTRSAFSPANSAEASSVISNSGKGQSSGTTTSTSAQGESSRTFLTSTTQQQQVAGSSNPLRGGHNEEHVRQSEAEFSHFLDGIDTFQPSDTSGREDGIATGSARSKNVEGEDSFDDAWLRSLNAQASSSAPRNVAEQEHRDGEDVLAILSDPNAFDYEQSETPLEDDENHDWGLSPEQLARLQAMTKELFPPAIPHGHVSTTSPLNLIPQFDVATSIQMTGYSDIGAVDQWREQWEGVLTRYSDEVWGGLLPLVKEARQEAENMREMETGQIQPKALRRLEAILGHLQKR